MMKSRLFAFVGLLLLSASSFAALPKLIVAVVVDQLRYDYIEKFHHQFSTNGFRLLLDRGAFMTFAHYNYIPTITGPGHASFLSGSTPAVHGIIANTWPDKITGKEINCVEDQSVDGVGATPAGARSSPRNFTGGTFADELRLRFNSKVVGISIKDRSAILPAGKKPAGAYWFHSKNGNFVTSTYYMDQLPAWVQEFNRRKRPADFVGQTWERLLDEKEYLYPDSAAGEGTLEGERRPVFAHKVAASKENFDNVLATPFSNQLLVEFAEAAIVGEKLGQSGGMGPDLLTVSFSALDSVGHRFGPYSQEVQDTLLRLDRHLERLFNFLDQRIGLKNVAIVLTSDHGVAPTPESAREQGLDGTRVNPNDFLGDLKERLSEEFGPGRYLLASSLYGGNLYLNHTTLQIKRLDRREVVEFIRKAALGSGRFLACYSREQLLDGRAPGPFGEMVLNGYNPERGGDLVLIEKPYTIPGTGRTGTTHGSPYSYDTHIPVFFYGAAFKPGRYPDEFRIVDIVPTLCAAFRMMEPPGSMGRPFKPVLAVW